MAGISAKCPYCRKTIALKADGTFRQHLMAKTTRYKPSECAGTGDKPQRAEADHGFVKPDGTA